VASIARIDSVSDDVRAIVAAPAGETIGKEHSWRRVGVPRTFEQRRIVAE